MDRRGMFACIGGAHGAKVLTFQPGMGMAIVGADLAESADEHNRQPPMTVPIALVNDVHFWGVTELLPEAPSTPGRQRRACSVRGH